MLREFTLQPFPGLKTPRVAIHGSLKRDSGALSVRYHLLGELENIAIPPRAARPERKSSLWESTCFELFLAPAGSPGYRECNASPAGHWNLYSFESYRQGMREESRYRSLPVEVVWSPTLFSLSFALEIDRELSHDQPLHVGVSAVIAGVDGSLSYWALHHPGPKPDFHRRDGFALQC